MRIADTSVNAVHDEGPSFERCKHAYFSRLGLQLRPELKMHRAFGLWGEGEEDWRRVSKHCMVVAARSATLGDLLLLPPELKNALLHAGGLHDFYKKQEVRHVREAQAHGFSAWDANVEAGEDARRIMERDQVDPAVRSLIDIIGNPGIKKAEDLLKNKELSDTDLASLALHYVDAMTRESDWSEPASISQTTHQRINALDIRVDGLEMKVGYAGFNEEGKRHFDGQTTYQALRRVGHEIERRLADEILRRTGMRIDPVDLPRAIDDQLEAAIRLEGMEGKFRELERTMREIGDVILAMRTDGLTATQKSHNATDFVTEADVESEKRLTQVLHALFPDHAIEGEEGTDVAGGSGFVWRLDPIDGTKPCREGGSFGISAGLSFRNRPVFGMIFYPVERKVLKAARGRGATINDRSVRASGADALNGASVGFDHSSRGNHAEQRTQLLEPLQAEGAETHHLWCATRGLLDVLEGRAAAYVCSGATPYDIAAGVVIADEAGCPYKTIEGPLDLNQEFTPIVFANNPRLLEEILALYRR